MTTEMNEAEEATGKDESEMPRQRSRWPIAGIVIAIVLVAAAFMAGRLLRQPEAAGTTTTLGPGGELVASSGGELPPDERAVSVQLQAAPELPEARPDAIGMMTEQSDNSIFVSIASGEMGFSVAKGPDGKVDTISPPLDGPKLEIVVGRDTQIYRDTTARSLPSGPEDVPESDTVQQTVELLETLPALPENTMILAWGQKTGDRLLADVLFFQTLFGVASGE
jgi:hypothetical protein